MGTRLTKSRKERIIKALEKKGIDYQTVDIDAFWDTSLSFNTNFEKIVGKPIEYNKSEEEDLNAKMLRKEEEVTRKSFERAIKKIKKRPDSEADKYFYNLREMVKNVIKGFSNGLIVIGEGGLGKSYQVIKTLLREKATFKYANTWLSPLELYHFLYKNKNSLIFIDDTEGILNEPKNIGILKSALYSVTDERVVSYFSTTPKLDAPQQFQFNGQIIICLNEIPKNKEVESLLTRVLNYYLVLDYETKIKCIYEIAKSMDIPLKICDFIKKNTDKSTKNLNFRTLEQIYSLYQYQQKYNGQSPDAWKKIARDLLKTDEDLAIVLDLMKSGKSVKDQIQKWIQKTGLSRSTYFRLKRKLVSKSQL